MQRRGLGVVLGITLCACTADPPGNGPIDTPQGGVITTPGSFYVGLLLADSAEPVAVNRTRCAVPIRGGVPSETTPLAGLMVEASDRGGRLRATADEQGRASLADLAAGVHEVVITSPDASLSGALTVVGDARRIDLFGRIEADTTDIDADGDIKESVLVVEVLPDDNQDRVSDTGRRAVWWFTADGGLAWVHLGNDLSERTQLDAQREPSAALIIEDRDGDFIEDAIDLDVDGDGRPNSRDQDTLACPGFSHDDLFHQDSEHKDFTCERCHQIEDPVALTCQDCHAALGRDPVEVPDNPPANHFQVRCEQCHVANKGWDELPGPGGELHEAFLLEGHHLRNDCFSCHETGNKDAPTLCVDCHLQDRAPDHFPDSCEVCHAATDWKPPVARHDQFPLAGGHEGVDCQRCHNPPDYTQASTDCRTCHMDDAPTRHAPAGFLADDCASCHEIEAWATVRYQHPQWPLQGQHQNAACIDCHSADESVPYDNVNSDCASCHEIPPSFPDHSNQATFGDCATCHEPAGWVPATANSIDHSVFPLIGSHETAPCSTCHEGGAVLRPPTDCTGCHASDRPSRHTGFFDGGCQGCHLPTTWEDLSGRTPYVHTPSFPLTGVHLTAVCSTCHNGATYDAPTNCIGCHMDDEPANHYGNDCAGCHSTADWNPSGMLNHHTVDPNSFPLTFGHANINCTSCHVSGFTALPENCEACHLNDQPAGHANDDCSRCHESGRWTQPILPAADVIHPLAGQHVGETCVECHGTYIPTVGFTTESPRSSCTTCHNLPGGHIATGATDCASCHTVGGWLPATGGGHTGPLPTSPFPYNTWTNNRWFPTNHRNANQCSDCHTNPNNFPQFSCTSGGCHSNQNSLNNKDDHNVNIYHYNATDAHSPPNEGGGPWPSGNVGCVKSGCHPTGRS